MSMPAKTRQAREVLNMPVPKVLAWCSNAEQTPVGSEYIIMDKASGVPLGTCHHEMGVSERFMVVQAIAGYQERWTKISYEGYGSLYFAHDLDESRGIQQPISHSTNGPSMHKYTVGPTNSRDWYDNERLLVELDRGPCKIILNQNTAMAC